MLEKMCTKKKAIQVCGVYREQHVILKICLLARGRGKFFKWLSDLKAKQKIVITPKPNNTKNI